VSFGFEEQAEASKSPLTPASFDRLRTRLSRRGGEGATLAGQC